MRTIQMTLDDDLVVTVDKTVKSLKTTRSEFTRKALRAAVENYNIKKMEKRQREGYQRHPIADNEFSVWEDEQEWGDE